MFEKINKDNESVDNVWLPDTTHFHLTKFVNKQNYRCWAHKNPTTTKPPSVAQQQSYHVVCWVIIWCNRPLFFLRTRMALWLVTSDRYVALQETFVVQKLHSYTQIIDNALQCLVSTRWINVTHSTNINGYCTPVVW